MKHRIIRYGSGIGILVLLIITLAHGARAGAMAPQVDTVVIGGSATAPAVDGSCGSSANEYTDASRVSFQSGGYPVQVLVKHTVTDLFVCMDGLGIPATAQRDGPNAALYLHRIEAGPAAPDADTFAFSISYNGGVQAWRGGRAGYIASPLGGHSIARQLHNELPQWSAEFRIPGGLLGGGWNRNIRIAFAQQWLSFTGNDYGWPAGYGYANPGSWAIGQLTSDSAPSDLDLRIDGIEVTQSIQRLGNDVPLVAGKRTFVRVHVSANRPGYRAMNVTARLFGRRGGTALGPLLPINPGGVIGVRTTPNRLAVNDAFLFELPGPWIAAGSLELTAEINPLRNPAESSYANNRSGPVALALQVTQPLKILLRNIEYTPGNNPATTVRASDFDLDMLESWLRRAYPINRLDSVRRPLAFIGGGPLTTNIRDAAGFVNGLLASNRVIDGDRRRIQVGMVTDQGGFMRGLAPWIPADEVATPTGTRNWGWDFDGSYGDWYGAHELGHAIGRPHVGRIGGGDIGCGADWWFFQEAYPYDHGRIGGQPTTSNLFHGFDPGDAGLNLPRQILPPTWTDVMSYCPNEWVSDFTYTRLRNEINGRFPAGRPAGAAARIEGDFLVISGEIDAASQTASMPIISREASVSEAPPIEPGPYALQLRNLSGSVLSSHAFTPYTSTEDITRASFIQVLNFLPGTRQIALVATGSATTLATVSVSANPPAVTAVQQDVGANLPATGAAQVTWSASDADGDQLSYTLKYSFDNKASWRTLAAGIKPGYRVDLSLLEGTGGALSGYFRVVANDGVNTGYADSEKFSVAGKAPEIRIANPANKSSFGFGQTIGFEAVAEDFEDGTLADGQVAWASSIDGALGTGLLKHEALLSPGTHIITATATDSSGQQASAFRTVTIRADTPLPANKDLLLDVAPLSLVFIGDPGQPIAEAQALSIRSMAGDPLDWTASSDAAWLSVSQSDGNDEADIEVSVDTSGMAPGEVRRATITIKAPDAANSAQSIPVIVQMEGPNAHEPPGATMRVYLPLLRR